MKTRPRYLATVEAEEGMVLGAPVRVTQQNQLRFSLPAGHELTGDNLRQLRAHRAEFLFVVEPDARSAAEVAADAARAARRVMEIFSGADFGDPDLAALFDQVLTYRSA